MRAIYFVVDENFEPIAAAKAFHLTTLTDADIHIFFERRNKGSTCTPSIDHPRIFYHIDELGKYLPKEAALTSTHNLPPIIYLRIFAPQVLHTYERLIYLDADIYVNYMPEWIWTVPIPDCLAAVSDINILNESTLNQEPDCLEWLSAIGLKTTRYLNTGVLVIKTDRWNQYDWPKLLYEYCETYGAKVRYGDQDFLNYIFQETWLELSPRFNFQSPFFCLDLESFFRPCFIHFTAKYKPWWPKFGGYHESYYALYKELFDKAAIACPETLITLKTGQRIKNQLRIFLTKCGFQTRREKKRQKWQEEFALHYGSYMGKVLEKNSPNTSYFADPLPDHFEINNQNPHFDGIGYISPYVSICDDPLLEKSARR